METDRAGRVRVQKDVTVPGHPEIFVVGDTASFEQDGKPLPGVAQVAIQQGRYAGKLLHSRITGGTPPPPFRYFDKGSMAVVGKGFAVLQSFKIQLSGFPAWLARAGCTCSSWPHESPAGGLPAMGLDVLHQPEAFSTDCEPPWITIRESRGEGFRQISSRMKNHQREWHKQEWRASHGKEQTDSEHCNCRTGVIRELGTLYLARGFNVIATDPAPNAEANLRRFIDAAWKDLQVVGLSPNASREHLQFTTDMEKRRSLMPTSCRRTAPNARSSR